MSGLILKEKMVDIIKCPILMSKIPETGQKVDCTPHKN